MTRPANARVAGGAFLVYIVAGIASLAVSGAASRGNGVTERLASIAQHTSEMRVVVLLSIVACLSAIVLGVTLYAITRDEDEDLALLGLVFRVAEGLGGILIPRTHALMSIASATGDDAATSQALASLLFRSGAWSLSATFFAFGSTLFSWLMLRGRLIPPVLAWLGVVASVGLSIVLPLQYAGVIGNAGNWSSGITWLLWMPMLAFEVTLAFWLIVKGVKKSPLATA